MDKENERQEIFSERVRAGKRTYFFDVKATRSNDYYLTITESKRRYKEDGFTYEKHKIFLYKEDFNKFAAALGLTIDHIKEKLLPDVDFEQFDNNDKTHNTGESDTIPNPHKSDQPAEETTEAGMDSDLKWD